MQDGVRRFQSTETEPRARGQEFGSAHAVEIARTVEHYRLLFASQSSTPIDQLPALGTQALSAIRAWWPEIADEIEGIADGAGIAAHEVAMINARTEILAHTGAHTVPECSTVVQLHDEGLYAQQNWDWYSLFENDWLVWRFTTADGTVVETMTEYGVVAKAGCNSAGIGVLFNILHHDDDGASIGVPVHVIARRVLQESTSVAQALSFVASAQRSASTTLTVVSAGPGPAIAVSLETAPRDLGYVFPDDNGLLVHTNHFLTAPLCYGDREHREFPDTVLRYDALRRTLRRHGANSPHDIAVALSDTTGGPLAVCCRPDLSRPAEFQYQTLAHVELDLQATRTVVTAYGPPPTTNPHQSP